MKLKEKGYTETHKTMSMAKANIFALLVSGPIAIICYILYFYKWGIEIDVVKNDILIFSVSYILLIIVHEGLHGLTWAYSCKDKWKSIRFGFELKTLTPYCHCMEPLTKNQYILGALTPLLITGIIPYIVCVAIGNYLGMFTSVVMIVAAGGDLAMSLKIIRMNNDTLILDHPTLCGCITYEKE
jgi:hypothetical protein